MAASEMIRSYLQMIIDIDIIGYSIKFKEPVGHVALSCLLTAENDSVYYPENLHFSILRKIFKSENCPHFCSHATSPALLQSIFLKLPTKQEELALKPLFLLLKVKLGKLKKRIDSRMRSCRF